MLLDRGMLHLRTFGYGHSFGVISHYYGREPGAIVNSYQGPFYRTQQAQAFSSKFYHQPLLALAYLSGLPIAESQEWSLSDTENMNRIVQVWS